MAEIITLHQTTAGELYQPSEHQPFDFIVGEAGGRCRITGPIRRGLDGIIVETEIGTVSYEEDRQLTAGHIWPRMAAVPQEHRNAIVTLDAQGQLVSALDQVTIEVTEKATYEVTMSRTDLEALDEEATMEEAMAKAISDPTDPRFETQFISASDLDWTVL